MGLIVSIGTRSMSVTSKIYNEQKRVINHDLWEVILGVLIDLEWLCGTVRPLWGRGVQPSIIWLETLNPDGINCFDWYKVDVGDIKDL